MQFSVELVVFIVFINTANLTVVIYHMLYVETLDVNGMSSFR